MHSRIPGYPRTSGLVFGPITVANGAGTRRLQLVDVFRLQALGPLDQFEFHYLPLVQGAIAIALNGTEVNENIDMRPLEGVKAAGGTWFDQIRYGAVPQVMPNIISYTLLRFEINIRASAILGFVGAGGIGYDLRNTMSWGQGKFDEAAAIFLLLFGAIVIVDQLSSYARNRLTHGKAYKDKGALL